MENMSNILNHVQNDNFVEFSKAIEQELTSRIHSHPYISSKAKDLAKYQNAEIAYKNIRATEEPNHEQN